MKRKEWIRKIKGIQMKQMKPTKQKGMRKIKMEIKRSERNLKFYLNYNNSL